jgi:hypothetical protein
MISIDEANLILAIFQPYANSLKLRHEEPLKTAKAPWASQLKSLFYCEILISSSYYDLSSYISFILSKMVDSYLR